MKFLLSGIAIGTASTFLFLALRLVFQNNVIDIANTTAHNFPQGIDCKTASVTLVQALRNAGYEASVMVGKKDGKGHAWITVDIEPQTGKFIRIGEGYVPEATNAWTDYLNRRAQ